MEALSSLFSLPHSVAVVVPSTMDVDRPMSEKEIQAVVTAVIGSMSHLFGGATATKGQGGWISSETKLVTENVTIVESSCSEEDLNKHIETVIKMCSGLKESMTQESIALKVDGKLFLV